MSEARQPSDTQAPPRSEPLRIADEQGQDPNGSFFVDKIWVSEYSDELIAEKVSGIPTGMFSLKEPTEVEILTTVFDALDILPLLDEIQAFREHGLEELADICQYLRDNFIELLRLSINSYRQDYMPSDVRDIEKITNLYEATTAIDHTDVLKALKLLKSKHSGSVTLYNAEAVLRSMYLD
ncbi:MAG TPA: hypothetical protein PJ984_02100 [Candidatus Saccharibacteria bacterium]|jgi:hypothetical protein|nr:hypothetical protein [Patescibacteria group bacterium]HMS31167.1 hypothetical protein [Candidatus Saccharibacteria bacterium]